MTKFLVDTGLGRGSRAFRVALATATFAVGCLLLNVAPALGHASYLGSTPVAGQRVDRAPKTITIKFSEDVNRSLSKATIVNERTGKPTAARSVLGPSDELVIKPTSALATAPYRVDWFSVSADDGHAEAGEFSFGVRTAAIGTASQTQQSPLARDGWLRIGLRALFYAALFFFAGGVLNSILLSGREGRGAWLVPQGPLRSALAQAGQDPEEVKERVWRRTVDAGWLAAASAALLAIADAWDASGGLSPHGLNDYLLTNTAGIARVLTVAALALGAMAARRFPWGLVAVPWAFLAIAFSGHANSADPHFLALLTDWIHLLAGAVWIGGIAQLAVTWTGALIKGQQRLRSVVMSQVLDRFGRVALPAFLVVLATGLANALIELGKPAELWQSSYGRMLAVKIALVGAVATISYLHALRLRPRLRTANPHPEPRLERRHWGLLRREPLVGLAVLVAAAVLVAFPLPPRQLAGAQPITGSRACNPCPLTAARDDQLAVADHLGPAIVAVWLSHASDGLDGRLQLIGDELRPLPGPPTILGADLTPCGSGCWSFHIRGDPASIPISAPIEGHTYSAELPARWIPGNRANQRARELLAEAQDTMDHLHSLRQHERITSGPGSLAVTDYRLVAPKSFAYDTRTGSHSITIGRYSWQRNSGGVPGIPRQGWQRDRYAGGGPGFNSRTWFSWTSYAQSVRLLGIRRQGKRRIAELAFYDQATPTWWRLRVDLSSLRSPSSYLIAQGHFMTQRYYDFNSPISITPPRKAHGG